MRKRNQLFPAYEYLDSQRLKDTFFTTTPKKNLKRSLIFTAAGIILLSCFIFFLINFSLIILPRRNIDKNGFSLLKNKNLSSISSINKDPQLFTKRGHLIHLNIIANEKNGLKIDLRKSVNLNNNGLNLYLKKSAAALKIELVVKDIYYHSNALRPLVIDIPQTQDALTKIPIRFENTSPSKTNLSKICQISIYFYPQNQDEKTWALINDLVLVKQ